MDKKKKLWISVASIALAVIICIVLVVTLVSCKKTELSATAVDTSKVTSNGGAVLVYDGELYFVNGTLDNDGTNNGGKTLGAVYKTKLNDDGSLSGTYTKVVDALVGYENGSINIIGDFLYFTTPNVEKNKNGEVLYNQVRFMRLDLKTGASQVLYTTTLNDDSEEVSFAYYKQANKLYLIVYEKSNSTLKSILIDTKVTTIFEKSDVTSAVFSEHNGQSTTGNVSADNFVFYTTAVADSDRIQTGNKVYKVRPDGSGEALISNGMTLSLLTIRAGKLLFTATFDSNTYVFGFDINDTTTLGDLALAEYPTYAIPNQNALTHIISYDSYDQIVFVENGSELSVLYWDDTATSIRYFRYENGNLAEDRLVYTFPSTASVKFIDTFTEVENGVTKYYAVFTNTVSSSSLVYKIQFNAVNSNTNTSNEEENAKSVSPTKLSTTAVEDADGNMAGKVILDPKGGQYVYVFAEDDDKNVLLYRIDLKTPEERAEENPSDGDDEETSLEVGKAELVGGPEI